MSAARRPAPSVAITPSRAPRPPRSSRLDHMDSSLPQPLHDLNLVENELVAYCSQLDPDDEPERCWQAYSFLEGKREKAQAGCDVQNAQDCAELQRLNDMSHQLLSTGSAANLVATFASLARMEEQLAAKAAQAAPQQQAQAATEATASGVAGWSAAEEAQPQAQQEDKIWALFRRLDANGDGLLSLPEVRRGMALLGEELDGATVALVSEAMDLAHEAGTDGISEQQFRDIVDAERLNSRSPLATLWRRWSAGHHHVRHAPQ